jgi:hypothetical protein
MNIVPAWLKSALRMVEVDRSRPLDYPGRLVHPEIERSGPSLYLPMAIRLQTLVNGFSSDRRIDVYRDLEERGNLKKCLSLHDALAIQAKGTDFFYKTFGYGSTQLFFWRSVVRGWENDLSVCHEALFVPTLSIYSDEVELDWEYLDTGSINESATVYFGGDPWVHIAPRSSFEKLLGLLGDRS